MKIIYMMKLQKQFLEYREKVIDVEIKYDPTPEKNLRKVFMKLILIFFC